MGPTVHLNTLRGEGPPNANTIDDLLTSHTMNVWTDKVKRERRCAARSFPHQAFSLSLTVSPLCSLPEGVTTGTIVGVPRVG